MSEPQRPYTLELEPPAKRLKPLNKLSEEGPLTQSDVAYFKKEAIWRQMQGYKFQAQQLLQDVDQYKQAYLTIEAQLAILDSWYHLIISLFSDKDAIEVDSEPTRLASVTLINKYDFELNESLEARRQELCKALAPFLKRIADDARVDDLLIKLEKIVHEQSFLRASNAQLLSIKRTLEARIEALKGQLAVFPNKYHRDQSITLRRADESYGSKLKESAESDPALIDAKAVHPESEDNSHGTISQASAEIEAQLKDALAQINILTTTNKSLEDLLADTEKSCANATLEKTRLAFKLENLSESDLENMPPFKSLIIANESLKDQISKLEESNSTNLKRLSEIEAREETWIGKLRQELSSEYEALREQTERQEQDLVRIRTARDELLGKNAILKAELDQLPSADEAIRLSKTLSEHMLALESRNANPSASADDHAALDRDSLVSKVQQLSAEIMEMEVAFRQVREASLAKVANAIDQENMVKKLSVEKLKADQKYFAAMRVKDATLAENRLLKSQVAKLQELVKVNADLEKQLLAKIDAMSAQVKDYRQIKEIANHDVRKLEARCKSLVSAKDALSAQVIKNGKDIEEKTLALLLAQASLKTHEMLVAKLQSQLKAATQQLDMFRQGHHLLLLQEDREQLDALRSIAKCSLCLKNWKDTAITVCGHVFCNECTNERLAARLRRCPTCNKGFSANDLLTVHL